MSTCTYKCKKSCTKTITHINWCSETNMNGNVNVMVWTIVLCRFQGVNQVLYIFLTILSFRRKVFEEEMTMCLSSFVYTIHQTIEICVLNVQRYREHVVFTSHFSVKPSNVFNHRTAIIAVWYNKIHACNKKAKEILQYRQCTTSHVQTRGSIFLNSIVIFCIYC